MEYRLSVRSGKAVVLQETHRTPTAAAERAEALRRLAQESTVTMLASMDSSLTADESEQAS
jgi:hypothetical protein